MSRLDGKREQGDVMLGEEEGEGDKMLGEE
jgi:hypothetical protein